MKAIRLAAILITVFILYDIYRCIANISLKIKTLEGIKSSAFNCKTASVDEINARCLALGKNDEYAQFMALCYRSGKTRKEIAGELNISEGTVKKYKHDRTIEMERPLS